MHHSKMIGFYGQSFASLKMVEGEECPKHDWDGPVILSPTAFVLVDAVTPWLRTTVPLSYNGVVVPELHPHLVANMQRPSLPIGRFW
ncbi:unnamed protein product [Effrenium voratum]|nr:unnamed protein product [Effrenium voratum]